MASAKKQFLLRMDPVLWARLEALAAQELRSVNGQIEFLLREGLNKHQRLTPAAAAALAAEAAAGAHQDDDE